MTEKTCSIYKVRYNDIKTHITHVEAQVCENGTSYRLQKYTRDEIIKMINDGFIVKTRIQEGTDYIDGASVIVWPLNSIVYIKTEPNDTEADNLGNLPTF